MNDNNVWTKVSIGFIGLLQLAFIILKLTGIIDWKWVFVLLPAIISGGFILLIFIIIIIVFIINDQ